VQPLHASANDGHHCKVTNSSKEILCIYYMYVLSCKCSGIYILFCYGVIEFSINYNIVLNPSDGLVPLQ
jgi:hypothetical protein